MYNTLLDPNISLACNFVDACRLMDDKVRTAKSKSTGWGVDVNNETFPQMFAMGCYLVNALRAEGITGVYKSLPFMYYYSLRQADKLPKYWISVRMFSILPRFADGKNKMAGAGLVPAFLRRPPARKRAADEFQDRGGHRTHGGLPLSFVPDVDAYWLGGDYIDVFHYLGPVLKEFLIPMSYSEFEETRPFEVDSESALLGTVQQFAKMDEWLPVAALFLSLFFPDRLQQALDPNNDHGLPRTTDGWLRLLGDTMQFAPERIGTLFMHGINAVYLALGKRGVDVMGRRKDVLG